MHDMFKLTINTINPFNKMGSLCLTMRLNHNDIHFGTKALFPYNMYKLFSLNETKYFLS